MTDTPREPPHADDSHEPPVPGFRTWRSVYLFVIGLFVLYVILMAVFTQVYT